MNVLSMKQSLYAVAVSVMAFFAFAAPAAHAQVPVTVTTDAPAMANQIETMAKWAQQYKQMESQILQMKQQYEAITGSRNFGDILNNPALANYLPAEWKDVYGSIQQGGYKGLSGSAQAIMDANRIYNSCERRTGAARTACERQAALGAQEMANSSAGFDQALKRLDQINQLMGQINGTTDAKGIAELQARIAGEQAAIQNEATKLQLYAMAAQAQQRMAEQQQREATTQFYRTESNYKTLKPNAVTSW